MEKKEKINNAVYDYFENTWNLDDFISEKMDGMSDEEKEDLYDEIKDLV